MLNFEQQPEEIRNQIQSLADEFIDKDDPAGWFDVLYQQAQGDFAKVPWAKMIPYPYLQEWLEKYQPNPEEKSALVIGCGLGDDGEALSKYGYQVTAFDISPTAINWCQQRFPNSKVNYIVGNLLAENPQWHGQFDFVFECRNIQALPLNVRTQIIKSIANFVAVNGSLLVIDRLRETETEPLGPPWALSEQEFNQFEQLGLKVINRTVYEENEIITLTIEYKLYENNN